MGGRALVSTIAAGTAFGALAGRSCQRIDSLDVVVIWAFFSAGFAGVSCLYERGVKCVMPIRSQSRIPSNRVAAAPAIIVRKLPDWFVPATRWGVQFLFDLTLRGCLPLRLGLEYQAGGRGHFALELQFNLAASQQRRRLLWRIESGLLASWHAVWRRWRRASQESPAEFLARAGGRLRPRGGARPPCWCPKRRPSAGHLIQHAPQAEQVVR